MRAVGQTLLRVRSRRQAFSSFTSSTTCQNVVIHVEVSRRRNHTRPPHLERRLLPVRRMCSPVREVASPPAHHPGDDGPGRCATLLPVSTASGVAATGRIVLVTVRSAERVRLGGPQRLQSRVHVAPGESVARLAPTRLSAFVLPLSPGRCAGRSSYGGRASPAPRNPT